MFDGSFRARAQVSLRGNSRKEDTRAQLLMQTQQARQQREQHRKQIRSAERIQKFVRRRLASRRQLRDLRRVWDELNLSQAGQAEWIYALRLLVLVFNPAVDNARFCKVAHALVDDCSSGISLNGYSRLAQQLAGMALDWLVSQSNTKTDPSTAAVTAVLYDLIGVGQRIATLPVGSLTSRAQHLAIAQYLFAHERLRVLANTCINGAITVPIPDVLALLLSRTPDILQSADQTTAQTVAVSVFQNILAVPLLPVRLDEAFTNGVKFSTIVAALPLPQLLPLWLVHVRTVAPEGLLATATLGNLVTMVKLRPDLSYAAMSAYAGTLAILLPRVPLSALIIKSREKTVAEEDDDYDDDGDGDDDDVDSDQRALGRAQMSITQPPLKIDASVVAQVRQLIDVGHLLQLRALLTEADKMTADVATAGTVAACSIFITLCTRWIAQSFEILNLIVFADWAQWIGMLWRTIRTHPVWRLYQQGNVRTDALFTDASEASQTFWSLYGLLVLCLNHLLRALDDEDFHQRNGVWPNGMTMVDLTMTIKGMVWRLLRGDMNVSEHQPIAGTGMTLAIFKSVVFSLFRRLYERHTRRAFMIEDQWLAQGSFSPNSVTPALIEILLQWSESSSTSIADVRTLPEQGRSEQVLLQLLKHVPFMIPFETRVRMFRQTIRSTVSELDTIFGRHVVIRRTHIFDDGFNHINPLGRSMKGRIRIQFLDENGIEEAGVDGGGVFKEFVTSLVKEAFDPKRGLFRLTAANQLYPNPHANLINPKFREHMTFLGRVFGKVLLEGILVEVPFAGFFLNRLLGHENHLDDLPTLDPELYKNLLFVKKYDGDVRELGLDFSWVDYAQGNRIIELTPNGRNIPVTNENRIYYTHLMASLYLNSQIHAASMAFLNGLTDLLNPKLLRLFSPTELQTLIGGVSAPIDLNDMHQHITYAGGFNADHPTIVMFWRVLRLMTEEQRRLFLRFVTSCSRPPLLGFSEMNPPLCIHAVADVERLPTASTCFNLLKLPVYDRESVLREKLLFAIESNAGFDLS